MLSRREKRNALILLFLMLIHAALEVIGVGIVPLYVSIVVFPEQANNQPVLGNIIQTIGYDTSSTMLLVWGSVALTFFFAFKAGYMIMLSYWKMRFVQNRVFRLGEELFAGYMRAPYAFHLNRNTAELLRNINQECLTLGRRVLLPILLLVSNGVIFLDLLGFLFIASPGLSAIGVILLTAVAAAGVWFLHKRLHRKGVEAREHRREVIQNIGEGLGGVKELRVLRREGLFIKKFATSLRNLLSIQRYVAVVGEAMNPTMEWVSIVGLLSLTVVLFLTQDDPQVVVSTVVLFAVALTRIKGSISQILGKYAGLRHNLVSVDTIYEDLMMIGGQRGMPTDLFATANQSASATQGDRMVPDRAIEFSNIEFTYPDADTVTLSQIDFEIKKGEAIGVVGPTGSGKSTLMDLLLGVLVPDEGRISVDGKDIHEDLSAWQSCIGYIPQAVYLIDGTIRQNIALGIPDRLVNEEKLRQAIEAAHLDSFVAELRHGLDTVVGERGVRVSGGQRQRIAIARALYHEPDVLIMDEATSALDNTTERAVIRAVEELKGSRTIVMIAHRLSTVENCDRIVYLDKGVVRQIGTYKEVMNKHVGFREMASG
jgi:ATP-binding cassette subfamily C protein